MMVDFGDIEDAYLYVSSGTRYEPQAFLSRSGMQSCKLVVRLPELTVGAVLPAGSLAKVQSREGLVLPAMRLGASALGNDGYVGRATRRLVDSPM